MPTLIALCGMPGSGKSMYALTLGRRIVTADSIRDGANPDGVFRALYARARATLQAGHDVVADTCALIEHDRLKLLQLARRCSARAELHVLTTPANICRARNARRMSPACVDWEALEARMTYTLRVVGRERWDVVKCM